ncbi:MAG: ECF-type sigma factor [Pirellulaceae bacterium]
MLSDPLFNAPQAHDSVARVLDGLRAGTDEAAQSIWDRYFPDLVRLAGQKLVGQRRQAADEEDVAISVMESFFRAAREGRFPDLRDRDGIWRLLAKMTHRKAVDLIRKNAARPIVGESALTATLDGSHPMASQPSSQPSPDVLALVADEIRHLIDILPDRYREVALHKLECLTVPEIARACGVHVSTIERRLRIIRGLWEREAGDDRHA